MLQLVSNRGYCGYAEVEMQRGVVWTVLLHGGLGRKQGLLIKELKEHIKHPYIGGLGVPPSLHSLINQNQIKRRKKSSARTRSWGVSIY